MKLRILHKGLILLLIPSALQVFLLFQLYTSFQEVNRLSKAEEDISTAIEVSDRILILITDAVKSAWRVGKSNSEPQLDPETFRTQMKEMIAQERQLVGGNPAVEDVLTALGPLTEESANMLTEARRSGPKSDMDRLLQLAPAAQELGRKQALIQNAKQKETEVLRLKREEVKASRNRIEGQIFFSAIAEIALTLGLLFYLLQDVTKRLKILVANAALVPAGKPLPARVSGGDELAYLDDVLHEAAKELEQAAQHRKTITEMVSHDLRSPLLAANVSLDLLLRANALDSRDEHDVRVQGIKRNLTRLTSFVEDLLAVDQLESGQLKLALEAVELRSLADEAIDNLSSLAKEKEVTLENKLARLEIVGDRNRLLQVLVNLLSNAIKFSPKDAAVVVSGETKDGKIIVSITDEGPGVPEAERAKLFEKFRQLDSPNRSKGFGLGLFICKLIVERHGGHVGVEGATGNGSRFWFSLPLDDDDDV